MTSNEKHCIENQRPLSAGVTRTPRGGYQSIVYYNGIDVDH